MTADAGSYHSVGFARPRKVTQPVDTQQSDSGPDICTADPLASTASPGDAR